MKLHKILMALCLMASSSLYGQLSYESIQRGFENSPPNPTGSRTEFLSASKFIADVNVGYSIDKGIQSEFRIRYQPKKRAQATAAITSYGNNAISFGVGMRYKLVNKKKFEMVLGLDATYNISGLAKHDEFRRNYIGLSVPLELTYKINSKMAVYTHVEVPFNCSSVRPTLKLGLQFRIPKRKRKKHNGL